VTLSREKKGEKPGAEERGYKGACSNCKRGDELLFLRKKRVLR